MVSTKRLRRYNISDQRKQDKMNFAVNERMMLYQKPERTEKVTRNSKL